MRRILMIASLLVLLKAVTACGVRDDLGSAAAGSNNVSKGSASRVALVLLFTGTGTSPGDVAAIKTILNRNNVNFFTVDSSQLNRMGESQIRAYRLVIIPGGNFIKIGNGLSSNATTNIRNAVQNGTSYLGICAGAFFAGDTGYNSLNLTSGVRFRFYEAEARGIRKAAVPIAVAGAATLEHYWEDGPEFTGWGEAVAKYPDGTPAVVQGTSGNGRVILVGVHPEAPASWRRGMTFTTPVDVDTDYAWTIVQAALNRTSLPHY